MIPSRIAKRLNKGKLPSVMASCASICAFIALTAPTVVVANANESFNPQDHTVERYEHIWTSSPFVAATESVAESQPLANRFALKGVAQIDGRDVVFLFDRTAIKEFSLTKDSTINEVQLVSVENGGTLETLKVRIKSGGEVGDLTYDKNSIPAPAAPSVASAIPNANPVPPMPSGGIPVPPPQVASQNPSVQRPAGNNGAPRPVRVIRRPKIKTDGAP